MLQSLTGINKGEIALEVIVVDDGSVTDNSPVIDQFKKSLDIRYYKKVNEGVASTRNFGFSKSRGNSWDLSPMTTRFRSHISRM